MFDTILFAFIARQKFSTMDETENCVICKRPLVGKGKVVKIREKGSEGINRASTERNDAIKTVPGQQVHQKCWRDHCLPSNIARVNNFAETTSSETNSNRRSLTRQAEQSFSFKTDCFFFFFVAPKSNLRDRGKDRGRRLTLQRLKQKTAF